MSTIRRKRPKLVWFFFLYYLVTITVVVGALVALSASSLPQARAAIAAMSTFEWFSLGALAALQLGGAFALVALRRVAFPLFLAALCVVVGQALVQGVGISSHGTTGANISLIVAWAIDVSACVYARRLQKRLVLT